MCVLACSDGKLRVRISIPSRQCILQEVLCSGCNKQWVWFEVTNDEMVLSSLIQYHTSLNTHCVKPFYRK